MTESITRKRNAPTGKMVVGVLKVLGAFREHSVGTFIGNGRSNAVKFPKRLWHKGLVFDMSHVG